MTKPKDPDWAAKQKAAPPAKLIYQGKEIKAKRVSPGVPARQWLAQISSLRSSR